MTDFTIIEPLTVDQAPSAAGDDLGDGPERRDLSRSGAA